MKKCVPCSVDSPRITQAERRILEAKVPDWEIPILNGVEKLKRSFSFSDFKAAMEFSRLVGQSAEKEGHHPSLEISWGKVTVYWWTHKIEGLTTNDFIMAEKTDELHNLMNRK